MAINYKPVWVSLAKKGLNKIEVIKIADNSTNDVIEFVDNK